MLKKYKTILEEAEGEIVEKKSRFIATVRPVKTEDEARAFIEEMKKKYWNATHNVFAYQIGERNELQRFSDDGEPQGTAGMPVLNVLKGEDVKDTAVVVTRYFGGTLLGTGGLVRAYGKAKELAATVKSGYLPVLDNVLAAQKGICFDYAAVMAGMLRSLEVPCKLVTGYVPLGNGQTGYHAWISVWSGENGWVEGAIYFDGTTWQRMDPTFASSANRSESIMQYIGDGSNYSVKYVY